MEDRKPIAVMRRCPMCGKEHAIYLSPDEYERYLLWENGLMSKREGNRMKKIYGAINYG